MLCYAMLCYAMLCYAIKGHTTLDYTTIDFYAPGTSTASGAPCPCRSATPTRGPGEILMASRGFKAYYNLAYSIVV